MSEDIGSVDRTEKRVSKRLHDYLQSWRKCDTKDLVGKLLTVVDGMTSDPVQRKAIKNLVENIVYDHNYQQEKHIQFCSEHLARALKENCDWLPVKGENKNYNIFTD